MKLKVMTYNIASGREHGTNFDVISVMPMADTVKIYNPDILALNEVRSTDYYIHQDEQIAKKLGYKYSFFCPAIWFEKDNGGGDYGNALLSNYPILRARTILIPDAPEKNPALKWEVIDKTYYETRVLLKATILINGEEIDVFVAHFGLAPSEQKNVLSVLKCELKKSQNRCILMGDLNSIPGSDTIAQLEELLNNVQPENVSEDYYTWRLKDPRKLDYIMVSESIKATDMGTIDSDASDHKPYWADLEL